VKSSIRHIAIGIIIGICLSIGSYYLYLLLPAFDFTPYYPQLKIINGYCEKYTTKNIAEIGAILLLFIPIVIFVIKERNSRI
jgi:hypothetical protein